ncbi:XRE family transcriptional regulator [Pseudomonas plecoglossicida]|uniref:XRE family transcriptional regulator n=1 Tax=Pseudomonas plecoglossicida TaxID=70775 RepID=A0ABX4U1V4_PSEDL|nr:MULTISPECIES: LexA family transcriptional regulator [Pseudomonas putida group]MCE0989344.1 LexA family transcriptional regulator [Pseudomonas alloputida]PLU86307.1 XRE family transcriptional regulator [Pseudomonas plecoglossicida]PLU94060.1 XRE family transcriptional regulator [Pseudomonas plecoglossicida]PLV04901.1 XRE family transcriptional regulator [Pseudomonas plecoglossicida]PLV14278.1 XRE family transcriptional regulator [Pseudomonas plecoglossicida]
MHKSIDKILAQLMAKNGISQVELSSRTSVGQSTISRILKPQGPKGIKEPTDKQVRPLAEFFGVTTDQLRGYEPLVEGEPEAERRETLSTADIVKQMLAKHGKGLSLDARQKIADAIEEKSAEQASSNVVTVDFSRPGQVGDEVWIAHYDVRAAMGGGQIPHDYPEMLQDIRVSPRHLREMGITFKEHYHLKVITGWGQSMAPTIKDRDPLLVDITIREFTGDGIYLFSHDEMLYVKRLQKKGKDRFKMISDNKHHDPEDIRVDDTHILARVLYVWNGQPV